MTSITLRTVSPVLTTALLTLASSTEAATIYDQFDETSPHTASISRSVFEDNAARVFGGAIVGEGTLPDEHSSLDINESTFERNTAQVEGGAIVFDSQLTSVRNSRFESNVATVTAGALATTNAVDTIVNATLFGARHMFTKYGTTIRHCEFTNNVARGDQAAHDTASGGPAAGINFAHVAASTATLEANAYAGNDAALVNSICAIGALVNGSLPSSSCSQRSGEGR